MLFRCAPLTYTPDEAIANKALEIVATAHPTWVEIAKLIPKGEFFR